MMEGITLGFFWECFLPFSTPLLLKSLVAGAELLTTFGILCGIVGISLSVDFSADIFEFSIDFYRELLYLWTYRIFLYLDSSLS